MKYGSVCSGIEAATAAWHPLGWEPSFFSEIEKFPRAVLQHHYPDVPLHGDFTTIQENDYDPIDLLVGGTPCQSFSIAGLRGGMDDDRGNLALEYLKLAQRKRPQWLVWENVPGVLSSNGGRDFGAFLGGLGELGYGFAYRVLDAQYFRVPQRRRRVFVIGYLGDWRPAAAVLFEREGLRRNPPPSRETRQEITGTLSSRTTDGGGQGTPIIAPTLDASYARLQGCSGQDLNHGHSHLVTCVHGTQDPDIKNNLAHSLGRNNGQENAILFDTTQITSQGNRSNPKPGDPSHTLSAGAHPPTIAFSAKDHGADAATELSPTLRAGGHNKSHSNSGNWMAIMSPAVRRLTPIECERLQGFEDNYTRIPYRGKPTEQCPDGPRYKAIGNSMATTVMYWLGQRIEMVDQLLKQLKAA